MARNENPPFERGTTFYGGATIDQNDLGGANLEGQEFEFEDLVTATVGSTKVARSGHKVRCRVVRNAGASAILPKTITGFSTSTSAGTYGTKATGTVTAGGVGYPVGDLFYVVVQGPALISPASGGWTVTVAANDVLSALTNKSVTNVLPSGGFIIGRACSGAASASTGDITAYVGR
jgi:hypothetical protein